MNLTGRPVSIAFSVLLAGCAWLAMWQIQGMMFAMGESVGPIGLFGAAFLIVTALGIVGLVLAALGSWTRHPFFSLAAIMGAVCVLPQALIYFKQSLSATIWQYNSSWVGASGILALGLDIIAGWLSLLRFRQLVGKSSPPTLTPQR